MQKKTKILLANLAFILICAGLLAILLAAPPKTTPPLPMDPAHEPFHAMAKKEAEHQCARCHSTEAGSPLPEGHPPPYRCLFCHQR